jgi:hypothetical protein
MMYVMISCNNKIQWATLSKSEASIHSGNQSFGCHVQYEAVLGITATF